MSKKLQFILDFDENIDLFLKNECPNYIDYRVIRKSLDARGANRGKKPRYQYQVEVIFSGENFSVYDEKFINISNKNLEPIIIGAGPAGLFCALRLLEYGIKTTIIERGTTSSERMVKIAKYWKKGIIDPESNVSFGEGGAGLFSDGKLVTRIKSPYVSYIMKKLVDFGAPKETAYLSNPHLGSNKIRKLITLITQYLKEQGCIIHFNTKMKRIILKNDEVEGIEVEDGTIYYSNKVILATGHSARDVYQHLSEINCDLKAKDFAVGVRVEHSRKLINKIQLGEFGNSNLLETANYRLTSHNKKTDRGTYSFCMCPGGYVLSSGTEENGLVTNGMSNFSRNAPWSNSALVTSIIAGKDFNGLLGGVEFQKKIEQTAYNYSKEFASGKELPAQTIKDFLQGKKSTKLHKSSCPSGLVPINLESILPKFIIEHLKSSLENFERKMPGFISGPGLLIAPETRTSSPVIITRDKLTLESTSIKGLFPCGEGAGHAGGITSAAVDGVKVAMQLIE
jgi:uncharacterized protein